MEDLYRLITMGSTTYAVELLACGRSVADELLEIGIYTSEGTPCTLVHKDFLDENIEIIIRDWV